MITDTYQKNAIKHIDYYHEFYADIEIQKENQIIFSNTINKDFITQFSVSKKKNLDAYILKNIWLDELLTEQQKQVIIYLEYCEPKTENCMTFKLFADKKNNFTIQEY